MKVEPHHPLQEFLAQLLHGIETVSPQEQKKMVSRACREAAKWHEKYKIRYRYIGKMKSIPYPFEEQGQ